MPDKYGDETRDEMLQRLRVEASAKAEAVAMAGVRAANTESEDQKRARLGREKDAYEQHKRDAVRPNRDAVAAIIQADYVRGMQQSEGLRFVSQELPGLLGTKAAQDALKALLRGDQTTDTEWTLNRFTNALRVTESVQLEEMTDESGRTAPNPR